MKLLLSEDPVLGKDDKGNTITILNKVDYNEKVDNFIKNSNITKNDHTSDYQKLIKIVIKDNTFVVDSNW